MLLAGLLPYILLKRIGFGCWLYLSHQLRNYEYGISSFGSSKAENPSVSVLNCLCDSNLLLRVKPSVMQCSSDTSGTRYNSTLPNNSADLNLYYIHCEDTKSHILWLPVTKIYTVIITALQVVTAFSRQGQFHDCDSIIFLPLGTELLCSDCMTCHSASGYDFHVFPVRCCQSSWCYRYS